MSIDLISVLGLDPDDLHWYNMALCAGMDREEFFDNYESSTAVAKTTDAVCMACPVARECFKAGIENGEWGVWGGFYMQSGRPDPGRNAHKTKEVLNKMKERVSGTD